MDLFHERVKWLKSIRIIDIFFSRSHGIANLGLEKLRKGLKDLSQIKRFTFSCKNHDVGYTGIKTLGSILKRLIVCQEIRLDLQGCKTINDLGLIKLSQGLRRCQALKVLRLDIPSDDITNKGLDQLSEALSKIISLESLEIVFKA